MLSALGERIGAQLDNLDLAEQLGYSGSAELWFAVRQLRKPMVHEYIEDSAILASTLQSGHEFVPALAQAAGAMLAEIDTRGWKLP